MRYPTKDNQDDQFPYPAIAQSESGTKKIQSLPSSYAETTPIYIPKGPSFAPKYTKKYDSNKAYIQEPLNEIACFEETSSNKHNYVLPKSWSKYHAEKENIKPDINGITEVLTLIPKPAHTLGTQYHCMQITKNTIDFLNPNQNQ